ncbi:fungal-specific transcription factor domain-containing protein [Daldinia vernicosa]|uniref:fungal-specific transcription factor domain-containing protein n=1 Tax=Daldinia vernicosa TaxID=114800 RepID=UPI002008C0DC|nr:fungal-specific transcription factor domain-containing protein [Daldinia vernicosa]KAI0853134.1 fungal-specific transcription factor domain-containing protein [Daldinia vernicosa]
MSIAPLPGIQPIIMSRPQVGIERLPSRRMGNEPREAMNCKSCRKRKIKCNRMRPSCEACQVFQCPCIYDAIPKKRGPKTDVLEALLKRVDGLEAQLKDHRKADASPTTEKLPHISTEETSPSARLAAEDSDSGPKSKRPTLDISRATEIASESAIYSPTISSEPSPGVQIDTLLDTYFSRFHAKPYHILDESSVRQRLQLNQLPSYLIYAIYSVAARYTTHPSGCQSAAKLSEDYALRSRGGIDADEPSIDALQALLLLVTAFTAAGKGKKAYMLLTIAIGMAMALELHREVNLQARITAVEREMRRRLFWTCYLLDRFMACGSRRPCLISDRTILLRLPCWSPNPSTLPVEGDFFQNGSNLQHLQGNGRKSQGSSGMLIDISRILGITNRYLAAGGVKGDSHFPWHALSELSKIRQDLDIWASGTADVFSSVDTLFGQPDSTVLVLSKLVYHLIHCLIYRPFLPIDLAELAGTGQHQSWQIEATNICFLHANAIAELVELGRQMPSIEWPAFVGYCICTAGTVHIHGTHYNKNGGGETMGVLSSSSEFLSRELQQLSELSYTWASVQHQRDTLQSIYSAHAELVKGLANNSMRYSPAFNLEDFFDRYSTTSRPGGRPFTFDATNLSLSEIATNFAPDTYSGPNLYSPHINTDFERPNLKRKNTALSQRRPDIRSLTPVNAANNRPLTPGLPTPGAHPRHFSFSTTPHASSMMHTSSSLLPHTDNIHSSATLSVQQRRETVDNQAISATATGATGAGFNPASYQPAQSQMEAMSAVPFSPSYQYATPSPSGDNESSLGVASYDPMFGTVPTNTFSSPTPWHGEEDLRKPPSHHLAAVPSPGAGSPAAAAPGEDKDPFLSLLEQLAENEHAIGQGKEIDFFLAGAQG